METCAERQKVYKVLWQRPELFGNLKGRFELVSSDAKGSWQRIYQDADGHLLTIPLASAFLEADRARTYAGVLAGAGRRIIVREATAEVLGRALWFPIHLTLSYAPPPFGVDVDRWCRQALRVSGAPSGDWIRTPQGSYLCADLLLTERGAL